MQFKHFALCAGFAFASFSAAAQAQDKPAPVCEVTTTRTACPGQEAESYKKCEGKKSCSKKVEAATAEACVEAAVASCSNDRLEITKSKTITVKFGGKAQKSKSGKDDVCLDYPKRAAEFDQCKK